MAVQLRLGLLSEWGIRTYPFDCTDPLAGGTHLTPQLSSCFRPAPVESVFFGSVAQMFNAIMRLFDLGVLTRHNFLHRRREAVI